MRSPFPTSADYRFLHRDPVYVHSVPEMVEPQPSGRWGQRGVRSRRAGRRRAQASRQHHRRRHGRQAPADRRPVAHDRQLGDREAATTTRVGRPRDRLLGVAEGIADAQRQAEVGRRRAGVGGREHRAETISPGRPATSDVLGARHRRSAQPHPRPARSAAARHRPDRCRVRRRAVARSRSRRPGHRVPARVRPQVPGRLQLHRRCGHRIRHHAGARQPDLRRRRADVTHLRLRGPAGRIDRRREIGAVDRAAPSHRRRVRRGDPCLRRPASHADRYWSPRAFNSGPTSAPPGCAGTTPPRCHGCWPRCTPRRARASPARARRRRACGRCLRPGRSARPPCRASLRTPDLRTPWPATTGQAWR